jgi:uracil-DNA glycosylase
MADWRDELRLLRDLGFTHLDIPPGASGEIAGEALARPGSESDSAEDVAAASEALSAVHSEPGGPATGQIVASADLKVLSQIAAGCLRCRLAKGRTQVVFGVGNPTAELMFIGEAPGHDEDVQGKPFVGRAGQLLTDIIRAMKLTRDQVYIANVIKCRPPGNRNPEPDELDACRPFIRRQVALIRPKVIVTLGRFALQSLMEKGYAISAVRGQWLLLEGVKVMPTYHPAYLLRNPAAKKDVWTDMKKVMEELGVGG